jgi:hypothetical protein
LLTWAFADRLACRASLRGSTRRSRGGYNGDGADS